MKIDRTKFYYTSPVNNKTKYHTRYLFIELTPEVVEGVTVYTLEPLDKTVNGKTYLSLKRLYLESEDVGEYEFANTHLASWDHWKKICKAQDIVKHINSWRKELALRVKSKALKTIINAAVLEGPNSLSASKFLVKEQFFNEMEVQNKRILVSKEEMKNQLSVEPSLQDNEKIIKEYENRIKIN